MTVGARTIISEDSELCAARRSLGREMTLPRMNKVLPLYGTNLSTPTPPVPPSTAVSTHREKGHKTFGRWEPYKPRPCVKWWALVADCDQQIPATPRAEGGVFPFPECRAVSPCHGGHHLFPSRLCHCCCPVASSWSERPWWMARRYAAFPHSLDESQSSGVRTISCVCSSETPSLVRSSPFLCDTESKKHKRDLTPIFQNDASDLSRTKLHATYCCS